MVEQSFVGNKPVDQLPSEATQKIPDEQLTKAEVNRDPKEQPGANKRAGIATRDPAGEQIIVNVAYAQILTSSPAVDTKDFGNSATDHKPQAGKFFVFACRGSCANCRP